MSGETMKAWRYNTTSGGLERNLYLPESGVPKPSINPRSDQILIDVISAALNPVDYKLPELGLPSGWVVPKNSTPGKDFCGRVAATGDAVDSLKIGQLVYGTSPDAIQYGSLGQFMIVSGKCVVPLVDGVDPDSAATIGIAGLTAYQSLIPNLKVSQRVFINGGSGGCGVFGIQIAKILGAHVTASCSATNAELCKSLGADEVLDYKSVDISQALREMGQVFDLAVDNVGSSAVLYKASSSFLRPTGKFVQVGVSTSLGNLPGLVSKMLLPSFLGGGKRKISFAMVKPNNDHLRQIGVWMQQGKMKAVIDSTFEFDDVPKAMERVKTGRAKGKIVVHVGKT